MEDDAKMMGPSDNVYKKKEGVKNYPVPLLKENLKEIPATNILHSLWTLVVKDDIKPANENPYKSHDQHGHEEML